MSFPIYQLYRMRNTAENADCIYQPYQSLINHGVSITSDRYELKYDNGLLSDGMSVCAVRESIEAMHRLHVCVSDVIVLRRNDSVSSFFWDDLGAVPLQNFFIVQLPCPVQPLTPQTTGYMIKGADGLWDVVDTITVDDHTFFIMDNGLPGNNPFRYVLDGDSTIVAKNARNESDAIARIKAYLDKLMSGPEEINPVPPVIEPGQTAEKASQQSPAVTPDAGNKKPADGKRVSVRLRLRQKQELIMKNRSK